MNRQTNGSGCNGCGYVGKTNEVGVVIKMNKSTSCVFNLNNCRER